MWYQQQNLPCAEAIDGVIFWTVFNQQLKENHHMHTSTSAVEDLAGTVTVHGATLLLSATYPCTPGGGGMYLGFFSGFYYFAGYFFYLHKLEVPIQPTYTLMSQRLIVS